MKFAKYLESESIPEWRKAYIDYKGLKKKLKAIEKHKKSKEARASFTTHISDDENSTYVGEDRIDPVETPRSSNLIRRARTEPYISSQNSNVISGFPSGLWRRLSWKYGRDTALSELESRPASLQSRQGCVLDDVLEHATQPERDFFYALDTELERIANFYHEKKMEAETKLTALKNQIMLIEEYGKHLVKVSHIDPYEHPRMQRVLAWMRVRVPDMSDQPNAMEAGDPNIPSLSPVKQMEDKESHHISYKVARGRLKKALFEFYRSLEFLRNYKALNATGFAKILKKFDKTAGWKATNLYNQKLQEYDWYRPKDLDPLIKETEKLYVNEFAGGHRRRGMRKLRIPETTRDYHSPVLRTGIYLGLALPALIRCCEIALDPSTPTRLPNIYTNLQIYACFLLPIVFCLGFSINLMVWHKSRINYKFIFEFDPRDNLNYHQFAELPSLILLIMVYVMYIDFTEMFAPAIPSEICPLIFFVISLVLLLCPFNILYLSARRWLGIALGRILLSYCFRVEFRDFFIADELNSLSYSFWTLSYFFCAYGWHWTNLDQNCPVTKMWITPILASLPPWWRLLQCIRRYKDSGERVHLINAGKYVTSIWATALTGVRRFHNYPAMQAAWIVACVVNSMYTSVWDLKMDWGLLQPHSRNFLLRNDLVFYHWTYYAAMPVNVILRFSWIVNTVGLPLGSQVLGFISGALEVYRRFQWNFFRLENEHLNNCGQFRAIKEIPLPFSVIEETENRRGSEIRLPTDDTEIYPEQEMTGISRRNTLKKITSRPSSTQGTFYGRRDFESKHDDEADGKAKPSDGVFNRITNLVAHSPDSDSEEDDDDDEEGSHSDQ